MKTPIFITTVEYLVEIEINFFSERVDEEIAKVLIEEYRNTDDFYHKNYESIKSNLKYNNEGRPFFEDIYDIVFNRIMNDDLPYLIEERKKERKNSE